MSAGVPEILGTSMNERDSVHVFNSAFLVTAHQKCQVHFGLVSRLGRATRNWEAARIGGAVGISEAGPLGILRAFDRSVNRIRIIPEAADAQHRRDRSVRRRGSSRAFG